MTLDHLTIDGHPFAVPKTPAGGCAPVPARRSDVSEEWRPVLDYEDRYEVSSYGRVRSLIHRTPKVLAQKLNNDGYWAVQLRPPGEARVKVCPVHSLMLEAFVGPRPSGAVTRHMDGDRTNNELANLAWGTYAENNADIVRHGRHRWAHRTHCQEGHEFTPANTYVRSTGARRCRQCERDRSARREWVGPQRGRQKPNGTPGEILVTAADGSVWLRPASERARHEVAGRRVAVVGS